MESQTVSLSETEQVEKVEPSPSTTTTTLSQSLPLPPPPPPPPHDGSNCSTPYVSAPSSPGHHSTITTSSFPFFYSAPASPMHYLLSSFAVTSAIPSPSSSPPSASSDFDFPFSSLSSSTSAADDLFLNGQIRPINLLPPLSENDDVINTRSSSRDTSRLSNRSQRRRARSLSPNRTADHWEEEADKTAEQERESGKAPPESASSSRCSSAGRSASKRWAFLTDFLRTKSDGRSFWHHLAKPKKAEIKGPEERERERERNTAEKVKVKRGKRRSAHEVHYAATRAQAEEMRKKTYLPYRQGLLGCLGFNSKSYGAIQGFSSALNPLPSST